MNSISSEEDFQKKLIGILLILFPKYILCLEKVNIKDENGKKRILDYLLVDANGNVDIIEIKKAFSDSLMSKTKYRDNYIPHHELNGSIVQVEKYLYYLTSNKKENEIMINNLKRDKLKNIEINIKNPQAMVICGRSNNLSNEQTNDFEIIRRNYKNIIDIITYDDLLERLKNTISFFSNQL